MSFIQNNEEAFVPQPFNTTFPFDTSVYPILEHEHEDIENKFKKKLLLYN